MYITQYRVDPLDREAAVRSEIPDPRFLDVRKGLSLQLVLF